MDPSLTQWIERAQLRLSELASELELQPRRETERFSDVLTYLERDLARSEQEIDRLLSELEGRFLQGPMKPEDFRTRLAVVKIESGSLALRAREGANFFAEHIRARAGSSRTSLQDRLQLLRQALDGAIGRLSDAVPELPHPQPLPASGESDEALRQVRQQLRVEKEKRALLLHRLAEQEETIQEKSRQVESLQAQLRKLDRETPALREKASALESAAKTREKELSAAQVRLQEAQEERRKLAALQERLERAEAENARRGEPAAEPYGEDRARLTEPSREDPGLSDGEREELQERITLLEREIATLRNTNFLNERAWRETLTRQDASRLNEIFRLRERIHHLEARLKEPPSGTDPAP